VSVGGPLGLQEHEDLVECRGLSVGGTWRDESWSVSATGLQSVGVFLLLVYRVLTEEATCHFPTSRPHY